MHESIQKHNISKLFHCFPVLTCFIVFSVFSGGKGKHYGLTTMSCDLSGNWTLQ